MHYLQPFLSPYTHPLASCIPPPFSIIKNPSYYRNNHHHHHYVCAVERDSEFEFDPDKAREALRKLDQQFQSISEKKISSPKIRATEFDYTREKLEFDLAKEQDAAGLPEESLQVFVVTALLLFTVFYNVFFVTVIKPSVDGPDYVPAALSVSETPESGVLQQLSPSSGVSVEP